MGGTSMATPLTAGTVALIRQYLQNVYLHNPSGALMKAMLIHGATPITGQYAPAEVADPPDNNQGWGRVNLSNSLFPPYPNKMVFSDDINDTLGTGEQKEFEYKVVNTNVPFRATLAWTDFPSAPAAGGGLVNSLRLTVIAPDSTVIIGDPPNNNVQRVEIQNPQTGIYRVKIEGVNIASQNTTGEKQDFALVVSAGLEFVDVYIKDNANDNGIPPSTGLMWQSPDIWVSLTNDPADPPAPNPEFGQPNYVFVRIHNKGPKTATNAEVKLYWAKAGTNLSRPYWKTDGIKANETVTNIQYVTVPANNGANEGEAIAAFEWNPPDPDDYQLEPGHFCLFATVSHPDDPLLMEDVHLVRWEDNLAWKNVNVIDMLPNTETGIEFYVSGKNKKSCLSDLYLERSALPPSATVRLRIPTRYTEDSEILNMLQKWESDGGRICCMEMTSPQNASIKNFKLKSNENTCVRLEVDMKDDIEEGKVYPVYVEQRINGICTGRVTLMVRNAGTPAFIANRRSGEIHRPDCLWVDDIAKRNKIPYNDLDLAIKRGYNGCRFCLPKYDTD